jgi:hypothetical protein
VLGGEVISVTSRGNIPDGQDPSRRARLRSRGKAITLPYHVHVYRDGELVVKWDLENDVAMKGEASRKVLETIRELQAEGLL